MIVGMEAESWSRGKIKFEYCCCCLCLFADWIASLKVLRVHYTVASLAEPPRNMWVCVQLIFGQQLLKDKLNNILMGYFLMVPIVG